MSDNELQNYDVPDSDEVDFVIPESTDFYLGDIGVAWITDKDTSISRDVVEKNFVDEPPEIFELTPDLESGTYSFVLNEEYHPRNETLDEQRDAIRSMTMRSPLEFPVSIGGDRGHIVPESSTATLTPSQVIDTGEATVRFLEQDEYKPAIKGYASPVSDDFSPEPVESVVPIPDIAVDIEENPEFSIEAEDGILNYYLYTSDVISYDLPDVDYTKAERISPVRLYDEDGKRVYSDEVIGQNSEINNGILRVRHEDGEIVIDERLNKFDWDLLGSITTNDSNMVGYASENNNYQVSTEWIDTYNLEMYRGFPMVNITFDGLDSITLDLKNNINSTVASDDYYTVILEENDGRYLFVMLGSDYGDINTGTNNISVDNISGDGKNQLFVGYHTGDATYSDFMRYMHNRGNIKRTFVQK